MKENSAQRLNASSKFSSRVLTVLALSLIICLGITIHIMPLTSRYPVFGPSGMYFGMAASYAQSWPYIPETLPIIGGIPATSNVPPLLPWFMAMLNRVFGLSLFEATKITPLLLYAFTAISLYFLAKEVTRSRSVSLMAVFMYSTSKLYFSTLYPSFLLREQVGLLFITLFCLFMLRAMKPSEPKGAVKGRVLPNIGFAGLSLAALISSHDRSLVFLFVILGVFAIAILAFDRPTFFKSYRIIGSSLLLGTLLATPILVMWRSFYFDRFLTVSATESATGGEAYVSDVLAVMGSFPYGYMVTCLGIIGLMLVLTRKQKAPGHYLLLSWFLLMYAFSEAYLFGIHLITFYPDATLGYASVPFSVLAAMGIGYFLSRVSQESVSFAARKLLIVLVVALVVVTQSYQASITLVESKKTYFNIDEEMEEGLIWLKSNTPTDSIIFISRFAPLNGYGFITGISGRTTLSTPDPAMPAGEYIQYQRESGSQVVITLDDPEQANSILHKYSLERSAGYVFIKKDQVDWANKSFGANISLERYDTYYKKVFENVEIVIYEVF